MGYPYKKGLVSHPVLVRRLGKYLYQHILKIQINMPTDSGLSTLIPNHKIHFRRQPIMRISKISLLWQQIHIWPTVPSHCSKRLNDYICGFYEEGIKNIKKVITNKSTETIVLLSEIKISVHNGNNHFRFSLGIESLTFILILDVHAVLILLKMLKQYFISDDIAEELQRILRLKK